ncbi:MAG: UrcA family protein [Novosphingobium sp.]
MFIRASIAALSLLATSAPVLAHDGGTLMIVRHSDLNLRSPEGRARFDSRLKSAARSLCETGLRGVQGKNEEARCMDQAMSGARARLGL